MQLYTLMYARVERQKLLETKRVCQEIEMQTKNMNQ